MIRIGSIQEMISSCPNNWMIVRKIKPDDKTPEFAKQVKALSPSEELFKDYRNIVHSNRFNKEWFDIVYVPRFLKDLSENIEAKKLLMFLCERSYHEDFFLSCFCPDEEFCHRSIIGGILYGLNANIESKTKKYVNYYEKYLIINESI